MNYRSKYVVMRVGGPVVPIVFSDLIGHADVAVGMRGEVLGAGFCYIKDGRYMTYGESVSLRTRSRPEDDAILNRYLGVVYE